MLWVAKKSKYEILPLLLRNNNCKESFISYETKEQEFQNAYNIQTNIIRYFKSTRPNKCRLPQTEHHIQSEKVLVLKNLWENGKVENIKWFLKDNYIKVVVRPT